MFFLPSDGSGGATRAAPPKEGPKTPHSHHQSTLPFGAQVPLPSVSGSVYVTAQLLVQQVTYALSDKIFAYDPPTFGLAASLPAWTAAGHHNIHGYAPVVTNLQTRTGAGAFVLGYVCSPDFDPRRRRVPQGLIAPSAALPYLRGALDQAALLHPAGSPLVAHVAAAAYGENEEGEDGFTTNYGAALHVADDLGLALVASASPREAQHMALLATLLAGFLPTLHVYDGVRMARETARVDGVLGLQAIAQIYGKLAGGPAQTGRQPLDDPSVAVVAMLGRFNEQLGTSYRPFEYHGHGAAEAVLVVFGSAESQMARQVTERLARDGVKVGAVNVRLYRPFVEKEFLAVLPTSARRIAVLGQVTDAAGVVDAAVQSALFRDVLAAVLLGSRAAAAAAAAAVAAPSVADAKYFDSASLTPSYVADLLHGPNGLGLGLDSTAKAFPSLVEAREYVLWDLDDSATAGSALTVAQSLAGSLDDKGNNNHVYLRHGHDNLTQGGIVRADIRRSGSSIDAPYAVEHASLVAVTAEKVLRDVDVLGDAEPGGTLLLKLPAFKVEDVEKRLPAALRRAVLEKGITLLVLDPSSCSPTLESDESATKLLFELAFLSIAQPELTPEDVGKLVRIEGNTPRLAECADALSLCLRRLDTPASWAETPADFRPPPPLPRSLRSNSFVPLVKHGPEDASELDTWQAAAKSILFKEAYGTRAELRPDLSVKTATIHVRENRRLTPVAYDRNIFHVEFDLGDSGLTYNIGEALGIHAENDEAQIRDFEAYYGLDANAVVRVPSREDPAVLEVRTVHQALLQSIDVLGKPPKRFYVSLARFAADDAERRKLEALGGKEGADDFKRRSEVDTVTYVDVLREFPSARPGLPDLVRIVGPLRRREYSIASAQAVTPTSVALMVVVVSWVDTRGRTRYGQATRYLSRLRPGAAVTVSVKPSVMKLPPLDTAPLIMAGLGTGLAPFRAFVQYRALQKARGIPIGPILLYLGSRHRREEYLYGEEWEAYVAAGVVTLLGAAFSRDQPRKVYIQDRMRATLRDIIGAYVQGRGSFYLCGPTWPVPDVTAVLQEAIAEEARWRGARVDVAREIEQLKEDGRYVLEVY